MLKNMLSSAIDLIKEPEARKIKDLDSPLTAKIHKKIIFEKIFLKRIYNDFYNEFKILSGTGVPGLLVELGSGSGFLKEVLPEVITTDVFPGDGIDVVLDGDVMPFKNGTVSVFFLQNVLHHIKDPVLFFNEVTRCLSDGGKIIMIEPYNSIWSSFVYKNFHHEPFDPKADWQIVQNGRLTGANGAMPWVIFFRDRKKFEQEFPNLKIEKLTPHTPFKYLLSGGLSIRQLLPTFMYDLISVVEFALSPINRYIGMFMTIVLKKQSR